MTPDTICNAALFSLPVRVDGARYHLTVYNDYLTIGLRPGKGRPVSWPEVARVADGPPADRFGVVVSGRLLLVHDDEQEANDRAADQRRLGLEATVIRVPVALST